MSFLAKLFINGRTINVLDTNIRFYQRTDKATAKPVSVPEGGVFNVTIETGAGTDLLGLMLSPDTMCEGHIRFYKRDGMGKMQDYEFFDTYIVSHRTEFDALGSGPLTDTLVFSPGILRIGDMVFEKSWKITDLATKTEPIAAPKAKKMPTITDSYYEDLDGKKLKNDELYVGETVNLVLHTQNGIGETINVDLSDNNRDFEYKGKVLKGDLLEDVTIIANPQKFRLKIIAQQEKEGQEE